VGLQWGDEGKGKFVDAVAQTCGYVVRYCGGANAGHTVLVGSEKYALHLIPSGILHPTMHNVVANGVIFDPQAALDEIDGLCARGVVIGPKNLHISAIANVVMPWHKLADKLGEVSLGEAKIGTTGRGIGPCQSDKASRSNAIRVGDLLDAQRLRERIVAVVTVKNAIFAALYNAPPMDPDAIWRQYVEFGKRLAPMVCDTGAMLRRAIAAGERICFEGGQGAMLDIDHGTFPFVTSTSVTAGGVPSGAGVPPKAVGYVVGVIKCYTSRVGSGPFPSEQDNDIGNIIRQRGKEYGTTTGRPRRCGWFDAVAVRYAADISGADELALALLLDGPGHFDTFRICTAYEYQGKVLKEYDPAVPLDQVKCVYEDFPTWRAPIADVKAFAQLPPEARAYVERIEQLLARPVGLISVGLGRDRTIIHKTRLTGLKF
jgi:adenylosuccinate synthase